MVSKLYSKFDEFELKKGLSEMTDSFAFKEM